MTLGLRLLLTLLLATLVTATGLGLAVRSAWHDSEEERFHATLREVEREFGHELSLALGELPRVVRPLCAHDPMLETTLTGLQGRSTPVNHRQRLQLWLGDLQRALRLDELALYTEQGVLLATGLSVPADPKLALARSGSLTETAQLRLQPGPAVLQASCSRHEGGSGLLLLATRQLAPLLREVSAGGATLSLAPPEPKLGHSVHRLTPESLPGLTVWVSLSREPLTRSLARLDHRLLALCALSLGLVSVLALLLARSLTRPLVELVQAVRSATQGDERPVVASGGRELVEFASAMNQLLSDLASTRRRLGATERIAAWSETARRVAHEVKNPLAPIRASIETLRRLHARGDQAFEGYFDEATRTVLDEVTRIARIADEFSRFARLPAPRPAPFDFGELLTELASLHSSEAFTIQLSLVELPPLLADREQLSQVLTNLLLNAREACENSREPRVQLELSRVEHERVQLRVSDNGPGIPTELRERIFAPYVTSKPTGTGLGLCIAERIISEHDGELRLEPPTQGGACFVLLLPLHGARRDQPATSPGNSGE